jgi:hypothetical protein
MLASITIFPTSLVSCTADTVYEHQQNIILEIINLQEMICHC